MTKPLVSIVVPTFNRAASIESVIGTVSGQSIRDWELIIVDDNAPDSAARTQTKQAITPFLSDRVRYVEMEANKGACAARNRGVMEARADFIAFLDDDDRWQEDKLRCQLMRFEQDQELALLICHIKQFGYGATQEFTYPVKDDFFSFFLNAGMGVCCSAIMVRKTQFEAVEGFDEQLQSFQDLDLMLRMSRIGKADVVPTTLLYYHLAIDGITRNPKKKIAGIERLLNKYAADLKVKQHKPGKVALLTMKGDFALLNNQRRLAITCYSVAMLVKIPSLKLVIKWLMSFVFTPGMYLWLIDKKGQGNA